MSSKIEIGIRYLVYQSMLDTRNEMQKMSNKSGHSIEKASLFLNYSNMMLQVVRALIQESLELEYELALEFEKMNEKLQGYKDKMGLK
jgi:hypothetical protein